MTTARSGAPLYGDPERRGGVLSGEAAGSDQSTSGGGSAGFSLSNTAWDVVAGAASTVTELDGFLSDVGENPALRAAATLRALDRLRDALDGVPADAAFGDPVVLRMQDVALIAKALLQRLH